METYSCAHHWPREFNRFSTTIKLMAPKFAAPLQMSGKYGNDDAAPTERSCTLNMNTHVLLMHHFYSQEFESIFVL